MMTNTNIFEEGNSEISGSRGGGDGDISSCDDFAPQNESEGEEFRRNFREGKEDESSNQPAPSENISQGKRPGAIVIVALAHHF
jgi:hypothetical protein